MIYSIKGYDIKGTHDGKDMYYTIYIRYGWEWASCYVISDGRLNPAVVKNSTLIFCLLLVTPDALKPSSKVS